eukprot:2570301-Pyramimonas_sp.AAC.1
MCEESVDRQIEPLMSTSDVCGAMRGMLTVRSQTGNRLYVDEADPRVSVRATRNKPLYCRGVRSSLDRQIEPLVSTSDVCGAMRGMLTVRSQTGPPPNGYAAYRHRRTRENKRSAIITTRST